MKKEKPKLPDRKFLVTTGSFIAGCLVDPNTHMVHAADHFLKPLLGMSEQKMREHCLKNGWALAEVSE